MAGITDVGQGINSILGGILAPVKDLAGSTTVSTKTTAPSAGSNNTTIFVIIGLLGLAAIAVFAINKNTSKPS